MGESSSSSELKRSITLKRGEIAEYVEGRTQGYRVRFDVIEAVCIDAEIFVYQRKAGTTPGETVDEFSNVASPADLTEYPANEPAPDGQFFRLSYVDLVFRNIELMNQSAQDLVTDIGQLVESLNALDSLIAHEITITGTSCPVDLTQPVVKVVVISAVPTSDDDITKGFANGSIWVDITTGTLYILTDNTAGAAVWKALVGAGEAEPMPHALGGSKHTIDTLANINSKLSDFQLVKNNYTAVTNPGVTDDSSEGYAAGSYWVNTNTDEVWFCVDAAVGTAIWKESGSGGATHVAAADPTVNDDGIHGYQTGSTWLNTTSQVLFQLIDDTTGTAVWRQQTNLSEYAYVVGPNTKVAKYTTVQAAVDAAFAAGVSTISVYLLPGSYSGDVVLPPNKSVNLYAIPSQSFSQSVYIYGNISFTNTSGAAKSLYIDGIYVMNLAGPAYTISGNSLVKLSLYQAGTSCLATGTRAIDISGLSGKIELSMDWSTLGSKDTAPICLTVASSRILASQGSSISNGATGDADVIRVEAANCSIDLGLGWRRVAGGKITGRVNIAATATNTHLSMSSCEFVNTNSDVVIDGTLSSTSHWRGCYNITGNYPLPLRIIGANATTFKETPFASAGDVQQYDGQRYQLTQLAAQQAEFLVGPAGKAKYTTIQSAIDAAVTAGYNNSNVTCVYILPGTYTENITPADGVYLMGLGSYEPYPRGDVSAQVIIIGTVVIDKVDAGSTIYNYRLWNIKITPTTGIAVTLSGSARKSIKLNNCEANSPDDYVISVIAGSPSTSITLYQSYLNSGTSTGKPVMIIPQYVTVTATVCKIFCKSAWFGATPSIQLTGGSFFYTGGTEAEIFGSIEVVAGTINSVLYVRDTVIVPSSGQPIFTIDGTLQLAVTSQHSYKNIRTELGAPATVSGTNASQFIELPTASAGDVQQYDGQRWQNREPGWCGLIATTHFSTTPASAYTITMATDLTAKIKVGMGLKLKVLGTYQYAIVSAITSNLLTIAGKPMSVGAGDLQELYYDPHPGRVKAIEFHFENSGAPIGVNAQGDRIVPWQCDICNVVLMANAAGSVTLDLWNEDDAGVLPPVVGDSITAADKPALAADIFDSKVQFTGWTHTLERNSILRGNIDAVAGGITGLNVMIHVVARTV